MSSKQILSLSVTEFQNIIRQHNNMTNIDNLVPIINIIQGKKYYIEHLWIVQIQKNVHVAISLKLSTKTNRIEVISIHLNKDFIVKSHQLTPYHCCQCLDNFVAVYDDIKIDNYQQQNPRSSKQKPKQSKQFIQNTSIDSVKRTAAKSLDSITSPVSDNEEDDEDEEKHSKSDHLASLVLNPFASAFRVKKSMLSTIDETTADIHGIKNINNGTNTSNHILATMNTGPMCFPQYALQPCINVYSINQMVVPSYPMLTTLMNTYDVSGQLICSNTIPQPVPNNLNLQMCENLTSLKTGKPFITNNVIENQNKQLRKENTELNHRINELENKVSMQDREIQVEPIAVPCDQKYVFYKSKLYQCKELIKLLANKVNEQELKTKAFDLVASVSMHFPEKDLITDDDSKSDEYKSVNDHYGFANQQSKITSDCEMQEQKDDEISPHHESVKNIEVTLLNEATIPNIHVNNPTCLFVSKSQLSATTDISSNNNVMTQSVPNPGLYPQFIDPIYDQRFTLSRPGSTSAHNLGFNSPFPYYIPMAIPYIQPPPPPQWPIYPSNNNPFYTQQAVPTIPKIVPQTINMPYPLPTLPPTKPNIFELRNLTTKMNVFISKAMTAKSLTQIEETFRDPQMLFYYLTHTINMQIYNQCVKQFDNGSIIVNLDLHSKATRNKLYAIVEKNDATNKNKYKWKLNQILEDATILNSNAYHISSHQLPISFRDSLNLCIDTQLILSTVNIMKLKSLYIVKNKSRSGKQSGKLSVSMTVDDLRKCIRESIDKQNELIPIVRFKDTKYWTEFILICETVDKFNFGVSFKYENARIQPTSIFVDRFDIERQNMLTGNKILSHTLSKYRSGIKDINIIEHCA